MGSVENELSTIYIKMLEWERLTVVRRTFQDVTNIGIKGLFYRFTHTLLGKEAEKKCAKVVGLIMSEDDDLPGTVKHL